MVLAHTPGSGGRIVRLLLVRHGQSEGNRLRQFSRDNHIDLTEQGVEQAREAGVTIGARFAPTRMVASPYRRTQRTAALIAEAMGHAGEIETVPEIREREIGSLAGAPYDAMREHPEYDPARFWEWRPPQGESLLDVLGRAGPIVDGLLRDEQQTVVVSHGGVMLALRAHLTGTWGHSSVSGNCEILVVTTDASGGVQVLSAEDHDDDGSAESGEGTG